MIENTPRPAESDLNKSAASVPHRACESSSSSTQLDFPTHPDKVLSSYSFSRDQFGKDCETRSIVPPLEGYNTHATVSFSRFTQALSECIEILNQQLRGLWSRAPINTVAKVALVSSVLTLGASAIALAPIQSLGGLAVVAIIHSTTYRENQLCKSQGAIGNGVFALHLACLGAWPAALQSTLSTFRPAFLAMVADDATRMRIVGGVLGFCAAGTVFAFTTLSFPLVQLSNLPLLVMALSTLAEAVPRRLTWVSRLCWIACSIPLIPYHILISGSWMGVGVNLFSVALHSHGLRKVDKNQT